MLINTPVTSSHCCWSNHRAFMCYKVWHCTNWLRSSWRPANTNFTWPGSSSFIKSIFATQSKCGLFFAVSLLAALFSAKNWCVFGPLTRALCPAQNTDCHSSSCLRTSPATQFLFGFQWIAAWKLQSCRSLAPSSVAIAAIETEFFVAPNELDLQLLHVFGCHLIQRKPLLEVQLVAWVLGTAALLQIQKFSHPDTGQGFFTVLGRLSSLVTGYLLL